MEFTGSRVILTGSPDQPSNTLSVIGEQFGRLALLVVPAEADPTRASTTVIAAANPDNVSTADELLGIGAQESEDRRLALLAHERWESDGGALRRPDTGASDAPRQRKVSRCEVLSDRELHALRDIERRLWWQSPDVVGPFNSGQPGPAKDHRNRARAAFVAAAVFAALALLGPRMLNEAEVSALKSSPLPWASPPDTTIAGRTDPVSWPATAVIAPVTAIDLVIAESTPVSTPSCHSPRAEHEDSRSLNRGFEQIQSLSRKV